MVVESVQGDGDVGEVWAQEDQEPGQGEAGEGEGEKAIEVDVTLDTRPDSGKSLSFRVSSLAERSRSSRRETRYTGIRPVGPNSLRNFKRTYKAALRRTIAMGQYNAKNPVVLPIKDDMRYRSHGRRSRVRNRTRSSSI